MATLRDLARPSPLFPENAIQQMNLQNMNQAALNRHADALNVQEGGACNLSGVARSLVRAINQCHGENLGTDGIRNDPAIRLIVHQMGHLCNIGEIDRDLSVYDSLEKACKEKNAERRAELKALERA
ncbi:hypothetical protein [Paraburkholderia adhaesiva]|uniref:hypothetical protein n=1 Tax=Paraburkholderia adhaesiva TaxID=2883244 RepID=UPI001F19A4D6|nr:hypothetical protein [Paraburkholderia adhaesiva]